MSEMPEQIVSWARTYSVEYDAMVYRRFNGAPPARAHFALVHDRDVPPPIKEYMGENQVSVCLYRENVGCARLPGVGPQMKLISPT